MSDPSAVAEKYSRKIQSAAGPSEWEQLADELSREDLTTEEFEEVATTLEEHDTPSAAERQVVMLGTRSPGASFVIKLARSKRSIRPRS